MLRKWFLYPVLKALAMNQTELLEQLNAANAKVDKIAGETAGLVSAVQTLQDALDKAGVVSPEVADAMANLSAKLAGVDLQVPDAEEVPAP